MGLEKEETNHASSEIQTQDSYICKVITDCLTYSTIEAVGLF